MQESVLYTIGYEGASLEDFIATLQRSGVEILLDIRHTPYSRKVGFSQKPLTAALHKAGIEYIHLKGLGNPEEGRAAAKAGDHETFHEIYKKHLDMYAAIHDLGKAAKIAQRCRAALLCFERKPCECHRSLVAPRLAAMTGQKIENLFVEKNAPLFDDVESERAMPRATLGSRETHRPCHA